MSFVDITLRDLLPIAGVIFGAIVGGGIAQFHAIVAASRERRRALRTLLYELLELRFQLLRSDPIKIMEALRKVLVRRFGNDANKVIDSPEISGVLDYAMQAARNTSPVSLSSRYKQVVEALAPHDPLIAYHLAGKDTFLELESQFEQYYRQLREHPLVVADPDGSKMLKVVERASIQSVYSEALSRLAKDIVEVAKECSYLTGRRIKRVLTIQDEPPDDEFAGKLLDRYLQEVLKGQSNPRS